MGEAQRKRLDHVVLPRRLPGLALLERYFPSPADNQLDAELASYARSRRHHPRSLGRHRLDRAPRGRGRHAGGGCRPEPLRPAGRAGLPAGPRAGRHRCRLRPAAPPRAASTCRCASTSRSCTPRAAPPAGGRWSASSSSGPATATRRGARSTAARTATSPIGGPVERVAPVDDTDLAKLGIERPSQDAAVDDVPDDVAEAASTRRSTSDDDLPPAPVGLTVVTPSLG